MKHENPRQALIAVASVTAGAIIGLCAHLLKAAVRAISLVCTSGFHAVGGNYALLWVPVAGIVVTGLLVRRVFRRRLEHATEQLKRRVADGDGRLSPLLMAEPVLASSVTLGCGGSAGSEGPIAFAGAAVGSNVAKWLRLSPRMVLVMMTCGAGAGIAAIFKAPVGGMLFTIEVLGMSLSAAALMQLVLMCVTSALTCFALSGFTPDMSFLAPAPFAWSHLLPTLLLGLLCGLYSVYYLTTGLFTRRALERMRRPLARNLVSGAILAIALFCFPALYGEGYSLMGTVVNGNPSAVLNGMAFSIDRNVLWALVGILSAKAIACYATNSGGGVAGDFAPTLFAGCMAGTFFALATAGWWNLPVGNFALAGMAGVMAGIIRAPFMAIFLAVEMTAAPALMLPAAICAAVSYFTSRALLPLHC